MAVKSYKQCIADNDYKSAIQNFKNTTERWKSIGGNVWKPSIFLVRSL